MKRGGSPFFYDFEGSLKTPKSKCLFAAPEEPGIFTKADPPEPFAPERA